MAIDRKKEKTLNKLGELGFDTEKKINRIDMRIAFESGLSDEIGCILELQTAIKTHSVISYLLDGIDPKPNDKKEEKYADDTKTGYAAADTEG